MQAKQVASPSEHTSRDHSPSASSDNPTKETPDLFQTLPDELVLAIFSLLPIDDLARRIPLVSRRFRHVSHSAKLWTEVKVCDNRALDTATVGALVDRCPLLRTLVLRLARKDNGLLAVRALKSCPLLETLRVDHLLNNMPELLKAIAEHGSSLRKLLFGFGCAMYHNADPLGGTWNGNELRANLRSLFNLTHIEVYDVSDEGLRAIADNCRNLEHFKSERSNHWSVGAVNYFLQGVKESLKNLELDGEGLTNVSFVSLGQCKLLQELEIRTSHSLRWTGLESISKLGNLRRLDLSRTWQLTKEDFDRAFSINRFARLTSISLRDVQNLDESGVVAIFTGCPNLVQFDLEYHVVEYKDMKDESLKVIADSCSNNLESFRSNLRFSNEALAYFMDHVKDTIRSLRLYVISDGVATVMPTFRKCHRLEELRIGGDLKINELKLILQLTTVSWLRLGSMKLLTEKDFVEAFSSKELTHLTKLDIIWNDKLDNAGLRAIANNCPELTSLVLIGCYHITGLGVRHILRQCCKLNSLHLDVDITLKTFSKMNAPLKVLRLPVVLDSSYEPELGRRMPSLDFGYYSQETDSSQKLCS